MTVMTSDLCLGFHQSAIATWDFLERARRLGHQPGEETITDLLVMDWMDHLTARVVTVPQNKSEEGRTGADWEWWFVGHTLRGIGFRVQAKIINFNYGGFRKLHEYTEDPGTPPIRHYQCDRLIGRAHLDSPRLIPIYCIYTHWVANDKFIYKSTDRRFGCSLLSARIVKALRKPSHVMAISKLRPLLRPLHTLVCPRRNLLSDLSDTVADNWNRISSSQISDARALSKEEDLVVEAGSNEATPSNELPAYVQAILDGRREVPPAELNLAGVVVFRESSEPLWYFGSSRRLGLNERL